MFFYEVVIDEGESPNRCTIAPLANRPDFRLFPVKGSGLRPLGPFRSSILLHPDGVCLTELRKPIAGIATIDCVWRRVPALLSRLAGPVPELVRIPSGFLTAYPRRSNYGHDPEAGLATIEAIFVASALAGNWDATLLSRYYFGRRFLEINAERFRELGLGQAVDDPALWPEIPPRLDSRQRRIARGKTARA